MPLDEHRRANRENWDDRVPIHLASERYDVATFVANAQQLTPVVDFDKALVGDVRGKRLLHLMCHFGLDTLAWARLGAETTGIDFSPRAIEAARDLCAETGLPGRFIEAELYDAPNVLDEQFDIVYTSHGVLCWLPDIHGWARVVSHFLRPGGVFLITEIHPIAWSLDQERDDGLLSLVDSYFETDVPLQLENEQTYTDGDATLDHATVYDWNHGIGEIVTALIRAGLQLEFLHEYPFVYGWDALPGMQRADDGMLRLPHGNERVPLMYSIRAVKPMNPTS